MVQNNTLLIAFLVIFALRSAVQVWLNRLNASHLRRHGQAVPGDFQETVDPEQFKKICAYTAETGRLGILSALADQGFFLLILLSGILPWWLGKVSGWGLADISSGLLFFAFPGLLGTLLDIPFSLYETFVIENRYGFNTRTFRIWLADLVKSVLLSALLGGFLLGLLLFLVNHGGSRWWLTAWFLVGLFELLILWLYPVLLAPLFNKFEPLIDPELVRQITGLMARAGLKARGVFRMDASRRSRHTNAYFTGLGRSRRIVLFDTLLDSHGEDEILSILAHEAGHWKKKHIVKQVILFLVLSLAVFYGAAALLDKEIIYRTFGFARPVPYVGFFLLAALFSPLFFFAHPLAAALSRRLEREADDFALGLLASPEAMIRSLKRLAADNLANLTPHPLYAWFYYSHPPPLERIARLKSKRQNAESGF